MYKKLYSHVLYFSNWLFIEFPIEMVTTVKFRCLGKMHPINYNKFIAPSFSFAIINLKFNGFKKKIKKTPLTVVHKIMNLVYISSLTRK